jgi:hypothetical protein
MSPEMRCEPEQQILRFNEKEMKEILNRAMRACFLLTAGLVLMMSMPTVFKLGCLTGVGISYIVTDYTSEYKDASVMSFIAGALTLIGACTDPILGTLMGSGFLLLAFICREIYFYFSESNSRRYRTEIDLFD